MERNLSGQKNNWLNWLDLKTVSDWWATEVLDKIRYSLLLKIHIQIIMLMAKNLQLFLYCLLYLFN